MQLLPREPVLKRVYIFFAISVTGFLLVFLSYFILERNQLFFRELEYQQRTKIRMSLYFHRKINLIQKDFQCLLASSSAAELERTDKRIKNNIELAQTIIRVLDKGGWYREKIAVDGDNYGKFIQRSEFLSAPENPDHQVRQFADIQQDLVKVEGIRKKHYDSMKDGLNSGEKHNSLVHFHQHNSRLFVGLSAKSSRLYAGSLESFQDFEQVRHQRLRKSIIVFTMVLSLFFMLAGWSGIKILLDIRRLIRERAGAVQALRENNQQLEQMVEDRTAKLTQEIEERKLAEEQLSGQRDFLTRIIESLSYPFYVISVDDCSVSMSNEAARNNVLSCSECGISKTAGSCRILPHFIEEIKKTGEPVIMEHICNHGQIDERVIEIYGHPVFNRHNQMVQIIQYHIDITEKYQAKKALEKVIEEQEEQVRQRTMMVEASERRFRKLIEGIREIITIFDQTGNIIYVSPSIQQVLGYPPMNVIGKHYSRFLYQEDGGFFINAMLEAVDKEVRTIESRVVNIHGEVRILESTFQSRYEEYGIGGLLVTTRDITERKKIEAERERLYMVVEQNPSAVIITDTSSKIEYVNARFEQDSGYAREEVIGKRTSILNKGHTDPKVFRDMYKILGRGEVWTGEFVNTKRSGELYTESVIVVPIKDSSGTVVNYAAIKENITELKKARELAESANQAKSDFLSMMSHELRTPLNSVTGFSSLLLESATDQLTEKQTDYISRINIAGLHLTKMIDKILDLSKIEAGQTNMEYTSCSAFEIIEESVMITEDLGREKNISIIVDSSVKNMPDIRVDRTRFEQIMLNIFSNAVKYNVEGGTVTIKAEYADQMVTFTITDTGIGIPQDKQDQLFTPFVRLAGGKTEGTGIGMTITRQLIEEMGGSISFTSEQDQGTSFMVSFPVYETVSIIDNDIQVLQAMLIMYIDNDDSRIAEIREVFSQWRKATLLIRKTKDKALEGISLLEPDIILLRCRGLAGMDSNFLVEIVDKMPDDTLLAVIKDGEIDQAAADLVDLVLPDSFTLTDMIEAIKNAGGNNHA